MSLLNRLGAVAATLSVALLGSLYTIPVYAQGQQVTVAHYFTGPLGRKAVTKIFQDFQADTGIKVVDNPLGHEDFKTAILVMAAGGDLPDAFSYWAGARTRFVVDSGSLRTIDDLWKSANLGSVIPASIAKEATEYNGHHYLIPFGYHYVGIFYNKKLFEKAGIDSTPKTWKQFIALCKKLKTKGITPIALGSKNRWPAQFWFDYIILRTAGPAYRARLVEGKASYNDPQVVHAMKLWKGLVDDGFFVKNSNADTWTDAADRVSRGEAAMTLMGTWITGYWDNHKLQPGVDYDFFVFPTIKRNVPQAALGPVDGWVISKNAKDPASAEKLLRYLITNTKAQAFWAQSQGALSPNEHVKTDIYNPVMKHALQVVSHSAAFAFNYDLATPPPVAEVGLSMFAQFMNNPKPYKKYLADTEKQIKGLYKKH